MRKTGVVARGIRLPVLKKGDPLAEYVVDNLLAAAEAEGFSFRDRDVVGITESIVARTQGNVCSVDHIARDVARKTGGETVGVIFPILSRNRFSILLKGIARGAKKLVLMLSYPRDEVGNALLGDEQILQAGIVPYSDVLTLDEYRNLFGHSTHPFTGVDYVAYYQELVEAENCEVEIIFGNHAEDILRYTDVVLTADIHTRAQSKRILLEKGASTVLGLDDIMSESIEGSGYNPDYGLLGSNKATEETVKLFPRDGQALVEEIQQKLLEKTGRHIEVMVYGDGAFKDPQGQIWELADPVVSPFHTPGLVGTPNEIKLKYLTDNAFANLEGEALQQAIKDRIRAKAADLKGNMASQGTTPRQITDLLGSLCDLVSGSGDKGTPVVLVQGYFDSFATE